MAGSAGFRLALAPQTVSIAKCWTCRCSLPFCLAAGTATDDDDVSMEAEGSEGSGKADGDDESPATTKGGKKGAPGRMVRCCPAHRNIL